MKEDIRLLCILIFDAFAANGTMGLLHWGVAWTSLI
jgi:hypothetical protein